MSDFDQKKALAAADAARRKGRRRAAIAAYRKLLAVDRSSPEIHAKLAPLLAKRGASFDAWVSFRTAAEGFMRAQQSDRALSTYYEAAHALPREPEIWQTIARLQLARGKSEDAVRALQSGRAKLRRRSERPKAIYLLRQIHELTPWRSEVVMDLAWLLARTGQQPEALHLLEALAQHVGGRSLTRARGLQARISPRPHYIWLYLRSALSRHGSAPAPSAARS